MTNSFTFTVVKNILPDSGMILHSTSPAPDIPTSHLPERLVKSSMSLNYMAHSSFSDTFQM